MTYISILDHSTSTCSIIEDEEDLLKDLQVEDIQGLLHTLGYRNDQISFMVSDEDPGQERVTLRELCDEDFDTIQHECIKRIKRA